MKYKNLRVGQVLAILKRRGYTVPEYRLTVGNHCDRTQDTYRPRRCGR